MHEWWSITMMRLLHPRLSSFILVAAFSYAILPLFSPVFAFGGSNIGNYYCPVISNMAVSQSPGLPFEVEGRYYCDYTLEIREGGQVIDTVTIRRDAVPKPPPLSILQVWFVRLIYALWGVTGLVFTGLLIWIGFKYVTSFGNEIALGDVVKDFRKWMIGLALIFLSYPVLVTFFRILPISDSNCYQDINMPGFQFFFPTACSMTEAERRERCLEDYGAISARLLELCRNGDIDPL